MHNLSTMHNTSRYKCTTTPEQSKTVIDRNKTVLSALTLFMLYNHVSTSSTKNYCTCARKSIIIIIAC